jgi:hypothetical protein
MKEAASSPRTLLGLLFDPEDGRDMFFRNVGRLSRNYTGLYNIRNELVFLLRNFMGQLSTTSNTELTLHVSSRVLRLNKVHGSPQVLLYFMVY